MRKKVLAIALMLVAILSINACTGAPSAERIISNALAAMTSVKTYEMDMTMDMAMAVEVDDEAMAMNITMTGSGACDIENMKMRADFEMDMEMGMPEDPDEIEMKMGMEMYLIDDMMYAMMDMPLLGSTWTKSRVPQGQQQELLGSMDIETMVELLEATPVKVMSSDRVNGIDCYLLQLEPDVALLWRLIMQQLELTNMEMPAVDAEIISDLFRHVTVKQWIAHDTYYVIKTEIEIALELTPEAVGEPDEEGVATIEITMIMLMDNYNQPVAIELPPEAEDAVEQPLGVSMGVEPDMPLML